MTSAVQVAILISAKDQTGAAFASARSGAEGLFSQITRLGIGVFAAGQVFQAVSGAITGLLGDAIESEKVMAQTNAVLASTQGAAGMSAEAIGNLAAELSSVTPFEDELIQKTENMLLTFTRVGKEVFPQATEAALDMATALGEDPVNAAMRLGKALNDPIEGVTALRRVGVQLSDAQEKQIEQFVKLGNVAAAQKVILDELATEFGNSARAAGDTFAGKLAILNTQIGNVKEAIGGPLIGALSNLLDRVTPVVRSFAEELPKALQSFASGDFTGPLQGLVGQVNAFAQQMFGAGWNLVQSLAQGIVDGANTVITQAATFVADIIASFLIGQSPPPEGPLSQIEEGGRRLIESYAAGIGAATLGPVEDVAAKVQASLTDFKGLEAIATDVEGQIRLIDHAMRDTQAEVRAWQDNVERIKRSYDDQIAPLQRQLELIREQVDLTSRQQDLADQMADLELKKAAIAAEGDPVERARLQAQLDKLKFAKEENDLAKARQAIEDRKKDKKLSTEEREALRIQEEELEIKGKLLGMVDREALAKIKASQQELALTRDTRKAEEDRKKLEQDMLALPLEQQIRTLKREQKDALAPAQEQLRIFQDDLKALQQQRATWQDLKADIKAASDAVKPEGGGKKGGGGGIKMPEMAKPPGANADGEKVGRELAAKIIDGLKAALQQHMSRLVSGGLGALIGLAVGGPLGAVVGAVFGDRLVQALQERIPDLNQRLEEAFGRLMAAVQWFVDEGWPAFQTAIQPLVQAFTDALPAISGFAASIIGLIQANPGPVLAGLAGILAAIFGPAVVSAIAAVATALFTVALPLVAVGVASAALYLAWQDNVGGIQEITAGLVANLQAILGQLVEIVQKVFAGDIGGAFDQLLLLIRDVGGRLAVQLARWGEQFVAWVAPMIPPLLRELLALIGRIMDWITEQGPPLIKQLLVWAGVFLAWVATSVVPKLFEVLGPIIATIATWVVTEGVPNLLVLGGKLAVAIRDGLLDILFRLGPLVGDAIRRAIESIDLDFGWIRIRGSGVTFNIPAPRIPVPDFGGGRAEGGPVSAGGLYLVGERGPELFRPSTSGAIIPHDKAQSGVTLVVNDVSDSGWVRRMLRGARDLERQQTMAARLGAL